MPRRRTPYPDWIHPRRVALGHRIAGLRLERQWSQDNLAERIGMDRRSVQRYEAGVRDPGYAELLLIADAFEIHVTDLLA